MLRMKWAIVHVSSGCNLLAFTMSKALLEWLYLLSKVITNLNIFCNLKLMN